MLMVLREQGYRDQSHRKIDISPVHGQQQHIFYRGPVEGYIISFGIGLPLNFTGTNRIR